MGTIEITTDLVWHVAQDPETLLFIASCDQLGIATRAVTFAQLYDHAFETSENLLRALHGEDVLEPFLEARGLDWEHRGRQTPTEVTSIQIRLFAEWRRQPMAMAS